MKIPAAWLGFLVASTFFSVVYTIPIFMAVPLPWYLPLAHDWVWAPKPPQLGMDWYGRTMVAGLVAVLAWTSTYLIGRRWTPSVRGIQLWALVAAAALLAAMISHGLHLWPRVPVPEPLPPWYQPR